MSETSAITGWVILELMGHRRLAGWLEEVQMGGAAFLRIDLPADIGPEPDSLDEVAASQIYSPAAVYCITPCTEETARRVAALNRVTPVHRWELPAAPPAPASSGDDDVDDAQLVDDTYDDEEAYR